MHTININEVFYSNYKNVVFKEHSCLLQRSQVTKYMSFFFTCYVLCILFYIKYSYEYNAY